MKNNTMFTPWGIADRVHEFTEGFYSVSTPSHGGFMLTTDYAQKKLTAAARSRAERYGGLYCYEEDCMAAIPMLEILCNPANGFRDYWSEVEPCIKGLSRWCPGYLLARGIDTDQDAYAQYVSDQYSARLRREKSPDLIVSAYGDWHAECEPGEVRVITADGKVHFIKKASYTRSALNLLSNCVLTR